MSEVDSITKRCYACGKEKELSEFHLAKLGLHGRAARCKRCLSSWHSANYAKKAATEIFFLAERNKRSKAQYASMSKSEKAKFMAKIKAHRKRLPNAALARNLCRALRRKPTENPVTHDELVEIYYKQDGKCALSGIKMTWAQEAWTETSMSIDRIDWRYGYVSGNVRLVCYAVNCFRQRMSDAEMLAMAKAIVDNMEKRDP